MPAAQVRAWAALPTSEGLLDNSWLEEPALWGPSKLEAVEAAVEAEVNLADVHLPWAALAASGTSALDSLVFGEDWVSVPLECEDFWAVGHDPTIRSLECDDPHHHDFQHVLTLEFRRSNGDHSCHTIRWLWDFDAHIGTTKASESTKSSNWP